MLIIWQSSYVAQLQQRKALDPPTASELLVSLIAIAFPHFHTSANLLNTLNQLVDALTGLERILTTPIPFSFVLLIESASLTYLQVLTVIRFIYGL